MKKSTTKLILAILALSLTAPAVVSCGEAAGEKDNTPQTEKVTETEAVTEAEIPDDLPAYNANGETFTINCDSNAYDWLYEEEDGDIVDDAIFYRNLNVMERFNVTFAYVGDLGYSDNEKRISQSIQAGDDEYALLVTHAVNTCKLAMQDFFVNWYDVPHVNFDKPWWAASTKNDLTYDGVCPIAVGDYVLNTLANTYCMVYNKNLAENYDMPDIYKLVFDGGWTLDKMVELNKDIYQDLNNNGVKDDEDMFGMASDGRSNMETYLWSFGGKIIDHTPDGKLGITYYSEDTIDMVNRLCSAFFDNQGLHIGDGWWYGLNLFSENRCIFANSTINSASGLREMKDDYGIIPYPKLDEAQDRYYTMADGAHGVLSVPVTCKDLERTGIIIESLNAETHKSVIPAYYETALKEKYARDEESIALLDLIVASCVFDMGYIYDGWSGAGFFFEKLVPKNDNSLASLWKSNEKKVTAHYEDVIEYFTTYGDK